MAKEQGLPPGIVLNRAGKYGVLKKIPKALWGHPSYKGKSKIIERSTGTTDRAAGLKAAMRMLADLEAEFDQARDELAAALRPRLVTSMSDDEMDAFVDYLELDLADVENTQACFPGGDVPPEWRLPEPGEAVAWHAKRRRMILAPALEAMLKSRLVERLTERAEEINYKSFHDEVRAVAEPAASPHAMQPQRRRHTLAELIERFKADPGRGADLGNYQPIFPLLYDVLGESKAVSAITHDDLDRVRDVLVHLPPYATDPARNPQWKGKDRVQIAADVKMRIAEGEKIRLLIIGAVNKYLTSISTLFGYARDKGMIAASPVPVRDYKIVRERQAEDKVEREDFPEEKLKAIFPKDFAENMTDVKWALAIALCQGFRGVEAAQLHVADIVQEDGIPCFRVDVDVLNGDGTTTKTDKTTKTEATKRLVPIHPKLIELGFLRHVEARKKAGEILVFDTTKYAGGNHYDGIRDDITAYLKACGAYSERIHVYHSLRHNWATAARNAGVPDEVADALGGWGSMGKSKGRKGKAKNGGDTARSRYGRHAKPAVLRRWLARIKYPMLEI
ncbi:tyrosine-type recombinase/integrase [Magnetospirillum aberrantis]|uniref:Tyrosine-type recombinase/integrase n=1 Tax=Magnetospirillum aberrantis SpK TaxID=908842 RepID=A0A7C9UXF2_9PROT|nr:tyrosine-type recombinase/integrase [Magnetospirillum aberrantis]NFV79013.1 tyrosine-type recombinase/integrase [Magnetospirillum aberrantis SpK]